MVMKMFLKRIIDLREKRNLSQMDMARIIKVSKSTYARWETDELLIPLKHLNTLCNYFKVSMDYMIGFSDKKYYKNTNKVLDPELIGKRIKELRMKKNLTQTELANEINTTQSVISAYEKSETRVLTAFAYEIVRKYNVSLDWLCGRINKTRD